MSQNPPTPGHGETSQPDGQPAPPLFPSVNRQPLTRREAKAREAAAAKAAADAAAAGPDADAAQSGAVDPSGQQAPAPAAPATPARSVAPLDFDAVITGPIAAQRDGSIPEQAEERERETVGARRSNFISARGPAADAAQEPVTSDPFATFEELAAQHDEHAPDAQQDSPLVWRQQHYLSHTEPPKKKRSLKPLWVTLIIVAIFGGLIGGAYAVFQPQIAKLVQAITPVDNDYTGNGTGQVLFTINSGDSGSDIANNLAKKGVTKSYEAFYTLLLRQKPEPNFQPGLFKLAKQMSAQAALIALQDPASKMENTAVIPEGTAEKDILPIVAEATKLPVADLQAAAANPAQFGVPAEAKTLEGFLFPATYTFTPGITAHDAIKTMVDRSFQALDEAGVAPADRWKTVVLASIVQREAGLAPDYPKVSRVFLNRLAQGWDLQSDATVAYGTGNTHTVTTTDAERADAGNPYNTYVHPGLPVGPISNPGDLAIGAAVHPADGPWMFFVTWNLKTGETIFSTTVEEHDAAVAKWQQWMRDNPGYE
ncbi:endolytic transglycosylase MltG [Leifsonia sp. Le1]|uniref:endolytic transglycosylase MltG n=1 Tax=Leifsonia sp. Le1 TaxID=3404918 RepID=UPI003EBFC175